TAPALRALKHVLGVLGRFHAGSESAPDLRPGALLGTRTEAEQFLAHRHAPRCRSALRSATPRHESPFRQTASATSAEVSSACRPAARWALRLARACRSNRSSQRRKPNCPRLVRRMALALAKRLC